MTMSHDGLTKLSEECAELIVEAQKATAFPSDHPDGKGDIMYRVENEIADVLASSRFVIETHGLDEERIMQRAMNKYQQYWLWHNDPEA